MVVLAGLLILVAGALLVGGLGNGQTAMLWASVGVSASAAVALVVQSLQRKRAAASADAEPAAAKAEPAAAKGEPVAAEIAALRAELAELRSERSGHAAPSAGAEPAPAEPAADEAAVATPAEAAPAGAAPAVPPMDGPVAADEPVAAPEDRETAAVAPAARTSPDSPSTGTHAVVRPIVLGEDGEPVEEDVVVTDLLLVIDLTDEVFVVDEHPRYHLAGCAVTEGEETFGMPLDEAKGDGFTACGICRPDRSLADAERRRRAAARS